VLSGGFMGRSDPVIFKEYASFLDGEINSCGSVAFLGFDQENSFTLTVEAPTRHFYDLQLDNWNINDDWSLKQTYDLIICTRCAYFSNDPLRFIEKCKQHLNEGGSAMIDWGLGDHWRFDNYKVGWLRDEEQEYAYTPKNFLYSCYWNDDLKNDLNVELFWYYVKSNQKFSYTTNEDISDVVRREVPAIVDYKTQKIKTVFLWPDAPQLYILTLIRDN